MDSISSGGMVTTTRRPEQVVVKVGMDLDGVNYCFERSYFDTLVALGEIIDRSDTGGLPDLRRGVVKPKDDARAMWFKEAGTWTFYRDQYGHTTEQFVAFCDAGADLGIIFGPQPTRTSARDAWRSILSAGHEIHVKTSRFFGSDPAVSHANTRNWLYTERLPYHSLTFCQDKLEGPRVDLMLEDNVDNYDHLDAGGVEVWLIDRPWNQDADSPGVERRRVFSHAEFVTRVGAYARRKTAFEAAVANAELVAAGLGG
jgi:hypothetical protein